MFFFYSLSGLRFAVHRVKCACISVTSLSVKLACCVGRIVKFILLYRNCESQRRFETRVGTSAHPAGCQQLSAVWQIGSSRLAAVKWPASTITYCIHFICNTAMTIKMQIQVIRAPLCSWFPVGMVNICWPIFYKYQSASRLYTKHAINSSTLLYF